MRELVIQEIIKLWSEGYCCMMNVGHEMGWPGVSQEDDGRYRVQTPKGVIVLIPGTVTNVWRVADQLTDEALLIWLRNCDCEYYR